jgi:hypothetical protein
MEMTRSKFICIEKGETGYSTQYKNTKVVLLPVTGNSEENKTFFSSTPSGRIELNLVNKEAAKQFEVGVECYVDFINPDDYQLIEGTAVGLKPLLDEEDLLSILKANNSQLVEAVKKQEEAFNSNCPLSIEEAARNCGIESGEGLMLVKLLQYLRGEKELKDLA